jgi:non-specific serine/threonine protein kinase
MTQETTPTMEIRLIPQGQLRLEQATGVLAEAFGSDWRAGLFALAAHRADPATSPTLRYWREVAERYLTALCHVPEASESFEVAPPAESDLASLVLTAPPMQGGEYLSPEMLSGIWTALDGWVHESAAAAHGLGPFLEEHAPKWRQVGRVCFHLAENKNDPARPFAFLATYTAGFGAADRLRHLPLRKALEQYAGAKNRAALVHLLSPVQKAAERCDWVQAMADSGEIYEPLAWTAGRAYRFLRSAAELEEAGLSVQLPNWWKKRPRPRVSVRIGETKAPGVGAEAMLDFDVRTALGDEPLSEEDLAALLAGGDGLVLLKGQWVEVDREKLREAIEHWEALRQKARDGEISFIEGMRLLAGASADLEHEGEAEEERPWAHVEAGEAMRGVLAGLRREPGRLDAVDAGNGLTATLRPYQREGLAWLHFLAGLGLGACLADDMGLGKTLQVLALLLCLRREKTNLGAARGKRPPALLVVPASLLGNWRSEAARFTPSLRLQFLHPAECDRETLAKIAEDPAKHLADAELVVTTYSMVSRQEWLMAQDWGLVILDEAQAIKNPATHQSRAVKKLPARARIALTGTPVENRLGDLWSIFDFLNPGLLGSAKAFQDFVKALQTRDRDQFAPLRRLVGPYILRRLKTDRAIAPDLPDKTETARYCNLTKAQIALYEQVVRSLESALKDRDVSEMARRGLVLQSLMRLKQICNHPSQLTGDADYRAADSGKFLRLAEICEELAERQERVLVFTQFREIIEPLAAHLARVFGRSGLVLHGGTAVKKRQAIVEQFQSEDGPPFFILSLKAGGTGLNLTAASHVIHFDRWWNPAVENQATDRAFRIGQKRNVLVHKFITSGTVEERIDDLIEQKRQMAEEVLAGGGEVNLTELPDEELLNLVRLDVTRAAL